MFQHTLETGGILLNLEQTNPSVLQNDETVKNCYLHYFLFQNFFKITDRKVGSDENNNNNKLQYGRRKNKISWRQHKWTRVGQQKVVHQPQ